MATKQQRPERDAIRLIAPGPVHLLSTIYHDQPNLMTTGWITPVGFDPPLIGVAIHPGRLSHEFATKAETFTLNIPTLELLNAVHTCGTKSGRECDKWDTTGLTPLDPLAVEAPLVAECVAHIECGVIGRHSLGDHDLFVGQILSVLALDEAFDQVWKIGEDAAQILHHLGADRYAGLGRPYQARTDEEEE